MTNTLTRQFASFVAIVATLVLFVAIWHFAVILLKIHPVVLPSPAQVAREAADNSTTLFWAFYATATASLAGLGISILLGSLIAIAFSQSVLLRRALYPYVVFLQTVPIIAIAPLLITWSGYYWHTIVMVSVIISLFPIISNVTAGLISVDKNLRELFRLSNATRWQTLRKLYIPHAVGHLILGARVSAGLAVIGAIVGEFFVGFSGNDGAGLGTIITDWQSRTRTAGVIAAALTSTVLGLMILGLVNLVAATLLRRWTRDVGFESGGS